MPGCCPKGQPGDLNRVKRELPQPDYFLKFDRSRGRRKAAGGDASRGSVSVWRDKSVSKGPRTQGRKQHVSA